MKIDIRSVSDGESEIRQDLKIDFADSDYAEYYPEVLHVRAIVDKFGNDYRVKVKLETVAHYICDSCLEPFLQKVVIEGEVIYQVGSGKIAESDDDVRVLSADSVEIDISDMLLEMLVLEHPIKMKCSPDCKGLCPDCGVNLNIETCSCADNKMDKRWEALKKLIK